MKFPKSTLLLLFTIISTNAFAQKVMWMKPKQPIVCYGKEVNGTSHVPLPAELQARLAAGRSSQTKTSNFIVTYDGFTLEAKNAFQKAVDIWESIIVSPIDIHVTARWAPLGSGVLGSATAGTFYANFDGAQQLNTWYPVALAEKMAARDLNEVGDIDIFAQFNSNNSSWYYGLDGTTPVGQYDLVTVVLHELGHGLGFLDSYDVQNDLGTLGLASTVLPVIYDLSLQNGVGQNLFVSFPSESVALKNQLTGNDLFYNSPTVVTANGGFPAKVWAPVNFSGGSSIAHLDEFTFAGGTANALMTPQIGTGESNFNVGTIVTGMFADMGWEFTYINHQALPNVERVSGPFIVKAVITSDKGPVASPKLIYNSGGSDIELDMTATGNPNEYQASIPATGSAGTYRYYITVRDNANRLYSKPGKRTFPTTGTVQSRFQFETGPDNKAPIVNHTAPGFILAADTALVLDAYITDNIGIATAKVEYSINNEVKPALDFVLQTPARDSIYQAIIDLNNGLPVGSIIKYRIVVVDNSSNANQKTIPATGFSEVEVQGLGLPKNSYANDFNTPSSDFFGNGFTIETPTGFTNPAIHSEHPYKNGAGFPGEQRNLIYQLKFPIKVKPAEAFIQFDEIALVEPGEPGTVFGDPQFWDYVVVEGSKDDGETWTPFANGYDARAYPEWLARYNSANDGGQNSTAVGDAALFKTRIINMRDKFAAGDEVAIRFRLFIDQAASGWGWAIDNIKIQSDITPPLLLHKHIDFVKAGQSMPALRVLARDTGGIASLQLTYSKNNGDEQIVQASDSLDYTFNITAGALAENDIVRYKFEAIDSTGNKTFLPVNGYFLTRAINFSAATTQYSNNFETSNNDFVGNIFQIAQPTGFNSKVLKTITRYPNGFGLDSTSNYIATLIKPIRIGTSNTIMRFDEAAIVQNQASNIAFGTPGFNDYVIVEGSKDGGNTWLPFIDGYDATAFSNWQAAFTNNGTPNQSLMRSRLIDLTGNGNFVANNEVIIRFRLFANATINGWGWAIDNLYIQDPITSIEPESSTDFSVFPNPSKDIITIESQDIKGKLLTADLMNANGQLLRTEKWTNAEGQTRKSLTLTDLPNGMYLLRISDGDNNEIRKIMKIN